MTAPTMSSAGVDAASGGATKDATDGPRTRRSWSLRSRLMWLVALATLFAWLSGGAGVLIAAHIESEQSYDEQLVDVARVILSFAEHEIEEIRADGRTDMVHQETAATLDPRWTASFCCSATTRRGKPSHRWGRKASST
jgi:hypothetical protein